MASTLLFIRDRLFNPLEAGWISLWSAVGGAILQIVFAILLAVTHAIAAIRVSYRALDWVWFRIEKVFLVVAMFVMTLAVFVVAVDRWFDFVDLGWFWATKLALFLMIGVGFLGASVAVKERRHLAIDVAGKALGPRGARIAGFFANLASAIFCFVLAWSAWQYVSESREYGDVDGVFPVPLWIVQLVMPLALVVMGARFIENIFREPLDDELARSEGRRPLPRLRGLGGELGVKDVILAGLIPGLLLGAGLVFVLGAHPGWLILIVAVLLLIIGTPLFVLIGVGASLAVLLLGNGELISVPEDMFGAVKKEVLLAIPFFILAGAIMSTGSMARRLTNFARALVSFVPGGMLAATVVACLLFGAISGSAPVTVIAIGGIMLPALLKEGHDEHVSLGLVTTSGALGILIPPSIPMIIYAIMAPSGGRALSIRELFVAGVLPGLVVGLVLAGYAIFKMDTRRFKEHRNGSLAEFVVAMREGVFASILIGLIFFGIYLGFFTVVEASAVAVLYALLVELVLQPIVGRRELKKAGKPSSYMDALELKPRDIVDSFIESSIMMGSIFLILVLSIAFNRFLAEEQVPQLAAEWLSTVISTKIGFLIMVNIFLIILGCLMEIMSSIMIVAPLLAPIAAHYGIDPIHFGIIFIVNLSIGYVTPPMGLNLFVASTVFDEPITKVIKATFPFAIIMLVALLLVTYVPAFSLLLLDR